MKELQTWCPEIVVLLYHGSQKERSEMQMNNSKRGNTFHVLITTLSYFDKDSSHSDRAYIRAFDWTYIIMDEAHAMKSTNSKRFERLMRLNTEHKVWINCLCIEWIDCSYPVCSQLHLLRFFLQAHQCRTISWSSFLSFASPSLISLIKTVKGSSGSLRRRERTRARRVRST